MKLRKTFMLFIGILGSLYSLYINNIDKFLLSFIFIIYVELSSQILEIKALLMEKKK